MWYNIIKNTEEIEKKLINYLREKWVGATLIID
jgi:hypothetical protein